MPRMRTANRASVLMRSIATAALALSLGAAMSAANAKTVISSQAGSIRLEAQDAPLPEVLRALGANLELRGRKDVIHPVAGTYAGSLHDVITRVLSGYDYVLKQSDGRPTIVLYGLSGDKARPAPAPAPSKVGASEPAPGGGPWPPPLPPNQTAVTTMLDQALRVQIPGSMPSPSGPTANAGGAVGVANSASTAAGATGTVAPGLDMAAMTRSATTALEGLHTALMSLPAPH